MHRGWRGDGSVFYIPFFMLLQNYLFARRTLHLNSALCMYIPALLCLIYSSTQFFPTLSSMQLISTFKPPPLFPICFPVWSIPLFFIYLLCFILWRIECFHWIRKVMYISATRNFETKFSSSACLPACLVSAGEAPQLNTHILRL